MTSGHETGAATAAAQSSASDAARRLHGVFIQVEIDDSIRGDRELAAKLTEACPVDIFAVGDSGIEIVDENLDECVLCELCLDLAPAGKLRIRKLYDDSVLERA